eukprot:2427493-Alexandrium_andersonii.AAC.1
MGYGNESQTLGGTLDDARQLGFAGAQSNVLLRGGPLPNRVLPSTRAPPHTSAGAQATRKVSVDIRAEGSPLILPQEVACAPRALDEVTGQARQRRPVSIGWGWRGCLAENRRSG